MRLTKSNWPVFEDRLSNLTPNSSPVWGTMSPAQMLAHLTFVTEAAMGMHDLKDESTFISRYLIKNLVMYVLPSFPRNVKAPDVITPDPEDKFELERVKFIRQTETYLNLCEHEPDRVFIHMFFGPMTLRSSQRLNGLHINHHFTQFGV